MKRTELAERMIRWMGEGYACYVARASSAIAGYCLYRDHGIYLLLAAALRSSRP